MNQDEQDLQDLKDVASIISVCAVLKEIQNLRRKRIRTVGVLPIWKKRREQGDGYNLLEELRFNPAMFFNYTRMNYERFEYLLGLCAPYLTKRKMSTTIPPEQRLALTLRFLATGDNVHSLALSYRCGFSTASLIIRETLSAIVHVLHRLAVAEPRSKQTWRTVAQGFHRRWNLPHVLGAIDGRHMQIRAPKASGSTFFNYRKVHSIVLLAIADSDYTFITVDVGSEGSQNDANILNESEFWKRVKSEKLHLPEPDFLPNSSRDMPYYFVGDGIFALQEQLMKPYACRKLTQEEAVYNYRISRAKRVVENAFGILVARWQLFQKPMVCSLETAENAVLAAVCLHNFIMRSQGENCVEEYNPPQLVDTELEDGSITPGEWRNMVVDDSGCLRQAPRVPRRGTVKACGMRRSLQEYLNNEGAVPWQVERVKKGFWGAHITEENPEVAVAREEEADAEMENDVENV